MFNYAACQVHLRTCFEPEILVRLEFDRSVEECFESPLLQEALGKLPLPKDFETIVER